jgi:tetratricopeptide (TPR) repeat protein
MVSRALNYLDRLSREAAGDPFLRRELTLAYMKLGDIQGNLYGPHVGDTHGAIRSYRQAFSLASSDRNQEMAAKAGVGLADMLALGGDRQEALERYRRAREFYAAEQAGPGLAESVKKLAEIDSKIGFLEMQLGDLVRARSSYERSQGFAEAWVEREPKSAPALAALGRALLRSGDLQVRGGEAALGRERIDRALGVFDRLVEADPRVPSHRRDLAAANTIYGDLLVSAGQTAPAVSHYQRADSLLAQLVAEDAHNRQYQRDLHIALGRLADAYAALGAHGPARSATRRALQVLAPLVDLQEPSVFDLQQYVWLLVTSPYPELRNPSRALPYAKKSVELTRASDPAALDALARAYFVTGNREMAVKTEQRALALLPAGGQAGGKSALRKELESNLATFAGGVP